MIARTGIVVTLVFLGLFSVVYWTYAARTPIGAAESVSWYFGALAALCMSVATLLAARPRCAESAFGGLARMYRFHKYLGVASLVLVLAHLATGMEDDDDDASPVAAATATEFRFMDTGADADEEEDDLDGLIGLLGMLSAVGFILLIVVTLNRKIPYHKWIVSHKLMGLFFALARAAAAGVLAALGLLVAGQSFAGDASSRSPNAADAWLQPSGEGLPFDPGRYRDFDDYVLQTRERLERHKVYMDPHRTDIELAAATPFERPPAAGCPPVAGARPSRGVLLLHGLSDMPLAMRDLADAFAARCFVVRAMLLPGHGTRAGDLLDVTHRDWLAATRFGLETLKGDVDEVFVGGFSLGGLLAMHAVLEDATVRGAFVFSPALALARAWLVRQSVWLRHVLDWLDRDAPDDYARYEAMPVNATAETFLLTRELARLLARRRVGVPVFMALSADDPVIDVAVNRDYFEHRFSHPGSRLVVYRRDPREGTDPDDARVSYRNSFLPGQRVAGFSHQSVHIAPANTHYGVNGDYRSCGQASDESAGAVARCLAAPHPWRGEVFGDNRAAIPDGEPLARLTYNPRFGELLDQVDEFLTGIATDQTGERP